MRHRNGPRKLNRTTSHRLAMLRNMCNSMIMHEAIKTTLPKAKELRSYAEKLITLARREDNRLHARRLVAREIQSAVVVKKLFDTLGARFATRPGGYTQILRLGTRRGDGAEMAYLQLVGYEYKPAKDEKGAKKDEGKKADEKKADKPADKKPAAKKGRKQEGAAAE